MPISWKNVYVFISSTFNDMHAERDYLVKRVFPRLRDWCELRRLRLIDIDLRWGVTETDATRNKNVVQVCLDRIDQCRPFFLCFLGQRYGWIPKREDIPEDAYNRFPGLKEAIDEGRSVTDLEVQHAVIKPFHSDDTKSDDSFFYFRDEEYLSDLPDEPAYLQRTYTDEAETDEESRKFLLERQRDIVSSE